MTNEQIVQRARIAVKDSTASYKLGKGGYDPSAPVPEGKGNQCDCSGFVSWCLGISRQSSNAFLRKVNGGWVETTGIVKDAKAKDGLFTQVTTPVPGNLLVYGDNETGQGHVGIITTVAGGKASAVAHCGLGASKRNGNFPKTGKLGKAIEESTTIPDYFYKRGAIHVQFDAVTKS